MARRRNRFLSRTISDLEDNCLFFALVLVLVFYAVVNLVPWFGVTFPQVLVPTSVAIFLLVSRILAKKMEGIRSILVATDDPLSGLGDEIRRILKRHPGSRTIDILATNAGKFYNAMDDAGFHAHEVRILIYERAPGLDAIIERWKTLQEKKIIGKLEINTYAFTPMFYGIVVDREDGCFGFFTPKYMAGPQTNLGTAHITGPYSLGGANPVRQAILDDLQSWFDVAFECHSTNLFPKVTGSA
jgi:hypothetical protein